MKAPFGIWCLTTFQENGFWKFGMLLTLYTALLSIDALWASSQVYENIVQGNWYQASRQRMTKNVNYVVVLLVTSQNASNQSSEIYQWILHKILLSYGRWGTGRPLLSSVCISKNMEHVCYFIYLTYENICFDHILKKDYLNFFQW